MILYKITYMKVLIVEDEVLISTTLSFFLKKENIDVCGTTPSSVEAIKLAEENKPDIIIMDTTLEDGDGITTTKKIKEFLDTRFIFCTGADKQLLDEISQLNPLMIIKKPFSVDRLIKIIKDII